MNNMSKSNLKSNSKNIKKTARKDIETVLTAELKAITNKFGIDSKKVNKLINSGAKKLAKKFAKEIKIVKAAVTETPEPVATPTPATEPAATVAKKKVKETAPVKA